MTDEMISAPMMESLSKSTADHEEACVLTGLGVDKDTALKMARDGRLSVTRMEVTMYASEHIGLTVYALDAENFLVLGPVKIHCNREGYTLSFSFSRSVEYLRRHRLPHA